MNTITKIVGLVMVLMIGTSVLAGLQSIKTTSLDPNMDMMDTMLASMGGTVPLGHDSDPEKVERQIQELMVFNVLSAVDCHVVTVYGLSGAAEVADETDDDADEFADAVSTDIPSAGHGTSKGFAELTALQGFEPQCVGAEDTLVMPDIPSARSMAWSAVKAPFSAAGSAVSSFMGTDTETPEWVARDGNDMEGKFGRIRFKIENIPNDDYIVISDTLFSMDILEDEDQGFWGGGGEAGPPLFRGKDVKLRPALEVEGEAGNIRTDWQYMDAAMQPQESFINGLTGETGIQGFYTEEAYAVRDNGEITGGTNAEKIKELYGSDFSYVFCEGTRGDIQTNKGDRDNEGESTEDEYGEIGSETVYPSMGIKDPGDCVNYAYDEEATTHGSCDVSDLGDTRSGGDERCTLVRDELSMDGDYVYAVPSAVYTEDIILEKDGDCSHYPIASHGLCIEMDIESGGTVYFYSAWVG